jgi:HD-like signal output (HDOD) protein/DNA-binding NarL/FixJ family response regulator
MSTTKVIALLCEPEQRRQEITRELGGPDTEVISCPHTDELYQRAMTSRIDAVVLDQRLQGFLTGLDVLSRLAGELVRPVSVLMGELSPTEKSQAAAVRPTVLLPADAAPEAIASAVTGALFNKLQGLPIAPGARRLVRDAATEGPLPQLIVKLAGCRGDADVPLTALAQEISEDARVTAELLKLVNSSASGLSGKVTRVHDAVQLLGVKKTVALVLSTSLFGGLQLAGKALPAALERQLRFRSLLMGASAGAYASMTGQASPHGAYVLALLQDIGVLFLAQELGSKYERIVDRCSMVSQLQLVSYEQREIGFTHADVSAALLQKWELPPGLVRLVLQHHQRVESLTGPPEEQGLLHAMQFAEAVADLRDQPTPHRQLLLKRYAARWGGMGDTSLRNCLAQSVAKAKELGQLFSVAPPREAGMDDLVENLTADSDSLPDEEPPRPADASLPRRRVVALDDDPVTLEIIEALLADTEFDVVTGCEPAEVWEHSRVADAILCDLHLDNISGSEVLRRLRCDGIHAPLLVISADRTRGSVAECIQAGACDYMVKPLSRETLLDKLRTQIARHA